MLLPFRRDSSRLFHVVVQAVSVIFIIGGFIAILMSKILRGTSPFLLPPSLHLSSLLVLVPLPRSSR